MMASIVILAMCFICGVSWPWWCFGWFLVGMCLDGQYKSKNGG